MAASLRSSALTTQHLVFIGTRSVTTIFAAQMIVAVGNAPTMGRVVLPTTRISVFDNAAIVGIMTIIMCLNIAALINDDVTVSPMKCV